MNQQQQYRIDIPAYEAWMAENRLGSNSFTADDIVIVGRIAGEQAHDVTTLGYFLTVDMPARFLIPVEA